MASASSPVGNPKRMVALKTVVHRLHRLCSQVRNWYEKHAADAAAAGKCHPHIARLRKLADRIHTHTNTANLNRKSLDFLHVALSLWQSLLEYSLRCEQLHNQNKVYYNDHKNVVEDADHLLQYVRKLSSAFMRDTKVFPEDLLSGDALGMWETVFEEDLCVQTDTFLDTFFLFHSLQPEDNVEAREALADIFDSQHDGLVSAYSLAWFVHCHGSMSVGVDRIVREPNQVTPSTQGTTWQQSSALGARAAKGKQGGSARDELKASPVTQELADVDVIWAIPSMEPADEELLEEAHKANVNVKVVKSAAALVELLETYDLQRVLRKFPDKLRLITHNHSYNGDFDMVSDGSAGASVLRTLKRFRLRCPTLIFCCSSIQSAHESVCEFRPHPPGRGVVVRCFATEDLDVARKWITLEPLSEFKSTLLTRTEIESKYS